MTTHNPEPAASRQAAVYSCWLGIDVGTGGSRALAVDREGRVIAASTVAHQEIRMDRPLWAEQDPDDWWHASRAAIRAVLEKIPASEIRGIGLSGQMHGLVALDRNDRVVRPALIWCDQRSQPQVDWINARIGAELVLQRTANPMLTGFTLPKLLWVRDHEPANFEKIRRVLLPKDYIRFQLTAEYATDVSDASGTGLLDVIHRRWSQEMAEGAQIDAAILAGVYESSEPTGAVTAQASQQTGLCEGTPVFAGAGDQAASAIGNGIVSAGIASCTLGTSGVVFAATGEPVYDPQGRVHTFCHAAPDQWHVMGVTQGAGLSLQWFRNQFAPASTYDPLMQEAAQSPPGAHGLFWLPYLMGERTPHLDPLARGGWIGITAKHSRADLIRAVIEGVCYSQKDSLAVIESMGIAIESVRASGGGARSPLWREILSSILAKRIATLEIQEGSAYGAALLAIAGSEHASIQGICAAVIKEVESIEPRDQSYASRYEIYRSLYPALREIFPRLS
jgi:xylulokinase